MTYQIGGKILASDFDSLLHTVENIYGVGTSDRGYGQTAITQADVNSGDSILASEWNNLRSMLVIAANQQGTSITDLPPDGSFTIAQKIIAFEHAPPSNNSYELTNYITSIDTNRLNTSMTALNTTTNVWIVTRASSWTGSLTAEISVSWTTEDDTRHFFNSGGKINMHGMQPTTTDLPQDIIWNDSLVNKLGIVKFSAHNTTNTGPVTGSNTIGYYELTDTYQTIYNALMETGGAGYSADNITISAKRLNYAGVNGGNGNGVQFRIYLNDTGAYASATTAAGTSFSFDNVIASTFLSGIPSPSYTTVTPF